MVIQRVVDSTTWADKESVLCEFDGILAKKCLSEQTLKSLTQNYQGHTQVNSMSRVKGRPCALALVQWQLHHDALS